MLASLMLAVTLAGSLPPGEGAGRAIRIANATVVHVTRPAFMSGVIAVYADFDIVVPGAERQRMYVLWMTMNQYLPDVGSVCAITYRREPLLGGNHRNPPPGPGSPDGLLNVVHELSCGPPLEMPRPGERSPGAL